MNASVSLKGMRGMIAKHMRESLASTAQLSFHAECDASALLAACSEAQGQGTRVSVEDLLLLALSRTLVDHPGFNGTADDRCFTPSAAQHIALAIAAPRGLVAPALFDVQDMGLIELAQARRDLLQRALNGKLSPREMSAGTFTMSNLGRRRVQYFSPILNLPQVAILGVGQTALRPWVDPQGELCVRPVVGLSLTVDHRYLDGDPAGAFLGDLCRQLEQLSSA